MNHTIYLHPKPTDRPEAHFTGETSVDLQLAPSIAILGNIDDATVEYMDRLAWEAAQLARKIRERQAAWKSYGVTM